MRKFRRNTNTVDRPPLFWLLTEGSRAITELGFSIPYRRFFGNSDEGDGHPVLVLPGFLSTDMSTRPLRGFIDKLGYTSYGWDLGRNTAKLDFLDMLTERVRSLYASHGERISLVGWSLGGVFARQIAKAEPDMIRQIVTLGSPFGGIQEPNNVAWLYNLISNGERVQDVDPALIENIPIPAPVPTTAVYTKEDGIVPWYLCMEEEGPIHQNVQVRGSHVGLGVNPSVLEIIADRLLHRQENWTYFRANNAVKDLLFYPSL